MNFKKEIVSEQDGHGEKNPSGTGGERLELESKAGTSHLPVRRERWQPLTRGGHGGLCRKKESAFHKSHSEFPSVGPKYREIQLSERSPPRKTQARLR